MTIRTFGVQTSWSNSLNPQIRGELALPPCIRHDSSLFVDSRALTQKEQRMARLEDLTHGASVKGIMPDSLVTIVDVKWQGSAVAELTYKDTAGRLGSELLARAERPA